ncbi:MAG: hypothetical protein HUU50_10945 [Candidatus Brocadiae bacterium]|nr:hypothetical protein [Candidatus Brocadiia bacterium]
MKNLLLVVFMVLAVSLVAQTRDANEVSREVSMLNAMLELENASWRADVTSVSMHSYEEMQKMMGLVEPTEVSREEFVFNKSDWPERGEFIVPNVTEVKNQASCGSCVAFGTTAAFEQTYWKKTGSKVLFSERYLFFCSPYTGYGCNGGWSLNGGAAAASNSQKGMVKDSDCKYYDGSYHYDCGGSCNKSAQKYTMSYKSVSANNFINTLKSGKAIIIGAMLYDDFRNYKSGVYEHLQGSQLGGHCMVLVGYGTTSAGENYWVVKNSWGTGWGNSGYVRFRVKSEQKLKDSCIETWGGYYFE